MTHTQELQTARAALEEASESAITEGRARQSAQYLGLAGRLAQWALSGGAPTAHVLWLTASETERLSDRAQIDDLQELDALHTAAQCVAVAALLAEEEGL